ncbi:MAG: permease [Gemmatimonadetes bacterium]|nr:permease [Gemmatimonadota bacterium]
MFTDLRFRLRAMFRKSAMERELDDELRFHVEHETEKHVRAGMSPADARQRALADFGGMERIKEDTREARGIILMQTIAQDLRYALRGLRLRPAFSAAIVLTLGLGIGTNAAMFGIIDKLMFRAPKFLATPERVHRVYTKYLYEGQDAGGDGFSFARFIDFSRMTTSFDHVAGISYQTLAVGSRDEATEMSVGMVSADFFSLFDAPPVLGRYFTRDEDAPPAGVSVVVLGHAFWQVHYGGTNVLGKTIRIGDAVYTIIGVAPEGFVGTSEHTQPAAFVPLTTFAALRGPNALTNYNWTWMDMIVRRRPNVSVVAANADLTNAFRLNWAAEEAFSTAQARAHGNPVRKGPTAQESKAHAEAGPLLMSRGPQADQTAHVATWVMGVALIVLLIACANVTNLLLAHAVKRRREIALRLALGVTHRRLLQQLLTESLLLALLGGAAGIVVAEGGGRLVRGLFLRGEEAGVLIADSRSMWFVSIVTFIVAILTGLAPAFHSLRGDAANALKAGSRETSYRSSGMRTGLLLFQGALSVVLLVGAGLFVRSLSNVRGQRLGYDIVPVAYAEVAERGTKFTTAEMHTLTERMVSAANTVPGVRSASLAISVPFWSSEGRGAPTVPGRDSLRKLGRYGLQAGSAAYFETVGTHIIQGRGFAESDVANSPPIIVVNEAMANAIWPGQNALGQVMRIGPDSNPYMTVVGVAENMRVDDLSGKPEFWYYLPTEQYARQFGRLNPAMFIRVAGRADDYTEALRKRLQQEMSGESYVKVVSLASLVANRQRSWDFGAKMFTGLGALALVLAAIGLYSVVAYMVAQRTHELAVRIALGAGFGDVMRMIVMQGVVFATIGIVAGTGISVLVGRWVEPLLFAQKANDPVVYGSVAGVLLLVSVAATLRPALRASRVDPMTALRGD